ncbi:hypothetical protein ACJIZ3_019236 [Penstemon smallii]|uniref:Uncharacterized protein n=1 Tax=Penstemon smallii TaxID=265156 RepID=A0ABD3T0M1_9LAMI
MEDDNPKSEEKLKSMTAIRCAKAAILLSSLTHTPSANIHRKEDVEIEMLKIECLKLKKEIRKLRM